LINDAEWGYNRDGENLAQVNVCLLLGEKSHLPIFQKVYSGSLTDVSTLKTTLDTISGINLNNMSIVMDKGFSKVANINDILSDPLKFRFLMPLKFTLGFAKEQVLQSRDVIDCANNTIVIGSDALRGITIHQKWNDEHDIFVHAILNTEAVASVKNKLFSKVRGLIDEVKSNPEKHRNREDVKKYLILRKTKEGYSIKIKDSVLESELETTGWLILISNHVDNAQEALEIYRTKDVVEKGFWRMKTCLDLARLRVHSDKAMQSKIFIGFIALIICAHIHKVMSDNNFYKSWSMKKMLKILERLKIHHIKSDHILSPLTKDQKRIFGAFGISPDL
jgi:transposase